MRKTRTAGPVRHALREATRAKHDRVDELFSRFCLDTRDGYSAFLQAHARALAPLEAVARPDAPRMAKLTEDLQAMGKSLPPPLTMEMETGESFRWGALYALEGSRLGGAMLLRRVAPGLPRAYLSAVHDSGSWIAFQKSLEGAAGGGGDDWIGGAVRGAETAFAVFAAAAESDPGRSGY